MFQIISLLSIATEQFYSSIDYAELVSVVSSNLQNAIHIIVKNNIAHLYCTDFIDIIFTQLPGTFHSTYTLTNLSNVFFRVFISSTIHERPFVV